MSRLRPRQLLIAACLLAVAIAIALLVEQPLVRFVGSLTACALALGFFRRAARVE